MRRFGLARGIVLLCALLIYCQDAFPLDPNLDISQYAHRAWTVRDGFAQGEVTSIAQANDGYLWVGTAAGLLRFDGVRAVPWQAPGNQHLPSDLVLGLLAARDGTLWIATGKGLASWKEGRLMVYPELADHFVFAVVEDHQGTVWASASSLTFGKICAIRKSRSNAECEGEGSIGRGAFNLYVDSRGTLWAGVKDGFWRWNPGTRKFFSLPGEPDGIQAMAEDIDGTLLVGWNGGLHRFIEGSTVPRILPDFKQPFRAKRLLRDREGSLWIVTRNGLIHVHRGRTDVFSQADGLSGDAVESVLEDREGNMWVATVGGLDKFRHFAVATLTPRQGLSASSVSSVLADRDGSLWLGSNRGLDHWRDGNITTYDLGRAGRNSKLNNIPTALFLDQNGRVWVSTLRGLGYIEGNRFVLLGQEAFSGYALSIVQDRAGNLWVDNEARGLVRRSLQGDIRKFSWAELGHTDYASVLTPDPQGGVWMGFFQGGIAYFDNDRIQDSYTVADGLPGGRVRQILAANDGTLWIATEGGLSFLRNKRIATLNSKNGLRCDPVNWAIEGNDHAFWLYTACGLVRITQPQLQGWISAVGANKDARPQVEFTLFDGTDGVRAGVSGGNFNPQVAKTADGRIWFLPQDGLSVIDSRQLPANQLPPPVYIEEVVADDRPFQAVNGMRLPRRVHYLAINYTALSFVSPTKVRFRYKLDGVDPVWREVINDRQVQYSSLAPGTYRFHVKACNNSGVWNETGDTLDFVIPPMWYQTSWFYALCAAALLALLWVAYRLRVRQLAYQFNMRLEERVGERTRIARDLHDTLLQSFQGLLPLLQASINIFTSRPAEALRTLEKARDYAAQAITEGRDAITGLRMSIVEKNDLAVAVETIGEEIAAGQQNAAKLQVLVEGTSRELHPILRDEVYRVGTEALRNAFRHAGAKNVEVEIRYGAKYFRLRVRDDGKGMAAEVLRGEGREGHFGLDGMRERAKLVGGKLTIWTELHNGTEIELIIPGTKAYVKTARPFWNLGKRSATGMGEDEKETIERE